MTRAWSTTSFFSQTFFASSTFSRRASATYMPPYLLRQRKKDDSETLCVRQTYRICTSGKSDFRRIRTICFSASRLLIDEFSLGPDCYEHSRPE